MSILRTVWLKRCVQNLLGEEIQHVSLGWSHRALLLYAWFYFYLFVTLCFLLSRILPFSCRSRHESTVLYFFTGVLLGGGTRSIKRPSNNRNWFVERRPSIFAVRGTRSCCSYLCMVCVQRLALPPLEYDNEAGGCPCLCWHDVRAMSRQTAE